MKIDHLAICVACLKNLDLLLADLGHLLSLVLVRQVLVEAFV